MRKKCYNSTISKFEIKVWWESRLKFGIIKTKYSMGLFSSTNKDANFLGVDIGGSSIKVVELANNNGRAQLVTYGYLERSLVEGKAKLIDDPTKTAEMIKQVVLKSKVVTKRAVTALPASAVYSSIIGLPEITRKDLASPKKVTAAVEWEAKKVLPMPIEQMVLDWKVLGAEDEFKDERGKPAPDKIKNLQVLLTGASKDVVQKFIQIFKKADLELLSLETEGFALARSMVGKDKSTVILVDIGAVNSDISIIENTVPLVNRTVGVGGLHISKAIAQSANMSIEQAEQFKRDLAGQGKDVPVSELLPGVVQRVIQSIIDEIEYTMNFYLEQPDNKDKRISKIVLSGGSANLVRLSDFITEKLNIRTFVGNPWARIIYPQDLEPILQEIGPRMASAIGLAMRDIEK